MKHARLWGIALVVAVAALVATGEAWAQEGPQPPQSATVEVTVWRSVSNPSLLYVSTRPEGGGWRTLNTALHMTVSEASPKFHQSNAVLVEVLLGDGATVTVEVTVWRRISNPTLLYVSTRPEGGRWRTLNTALHMTVSEASPKFHQSNVVLVEVPVPVPVPAADEESPARVCRWQETAAHVVASTVKVTTPTVTGSAFYVGNGQFVTAGHVVEDRPSRITLSNEHVFLTARLVGFYNFDNGDVALLAASAPSLTALEWAGTLTIGSDIAIAGYPEALGTTASWTRGTVSRLFTEDGISTIQTDAASSPGNSGGPLVDVCGHVAGIISASYIGERGSEGLHFAISEPTLGQKLVALGLTGYEIAPGGVVPDDVAEYVDPEVRSFRLSGTVFFDTGEWGGQAYITKVPPDGTVVLAIVGGEVCATATTSVRGPWAYYEFAVEEGCGGAAPGVGVDLHVDGTWARQMVWESGAAEQRLAILRKIAPTTEEIDDYVRGILEAWGEAIANINAGQTFRCYTWESDCTIRNNTWKEWMVDRLGTTRLRALNNNTVEAWRAAALAFWESVTESPLEFYQAREDAAYEVYLDASCDLWLMQEYLNAVEVCAAANPPAWEEIDSLSDRVLEHWGPTLTAQSVLISQWNAVIDTEDSPSNRLAGIARQQITIVQSMLDGLTLLRSDTATRNAIASGYLEAAISYWTAALKGVEAYEAYALAQVGWADVETANATTATAFSEFRNAECALFQLQEYSTADQVCALAGQ